MTESNVGEGAASGFDPGEGSASAEKDKDNAIDLETNVSKDAANDGDSGDQSAADAPQTGEAPADPNDPNAQTTQA